ncbi:hypothetical protein BLGI_1088 [Brevibacillus laterosporus GI-9]|nr:hypothetical protein BLGI_1088 [Brevibacillus laterosporus GI-9]
MSGILSLKRVTASSIEANRMDWLITANRANNTNMLKSEVEAPIFPVRAPESLAA